jgi:hypothetical protein
MNFLSKHPPICYGKLIVQMTYRILLLWLCCALFAGTARADTFHLTDGKTVSGDVVSMDEQGIILKQPDGSYGERMPWAKFSQADLKDLQQNPRAAQYVAPFIEQSQQDKVKRTQIDIKDFAKLPRPAKKSLIGALLTSPMGLVIFILVYGANLYAAYEIAIFRAQPLGLVIGVSAVAPFVGPIIFLSLPHRVKKKETEWVAPAETGLDPAIAAVVAAEEAATAVGQSEVAVEQQQAANEPVAPALPPPKVFARGQFTFNRRFFETQMPAFFAITRPEAEKDKVLLVKSSRGNYDAKRISRISATDVTFQVQKGVASEDVIIPFVEIQEIQLKHKDA